jgi:hypothetical protein
MRRALQVLALAAAVAGALAYPQGHARAQTVRLYLQRLAQRPAEILLVPGFLTILEFEDAVNAVATGNPGIVELVDVSGGTVMLRPRAGSGSTDIVVSVADVRALFRARIASQPRTTHKYVVTSSAPPEPETTSEKPQPPRPATQVGTRAPAPQPSPTPAAQPAPASEWDTFVNTLSPQQKALLLALMRDLSLGRLFEFLQALSPQQRETFLRLARFRGLDPSSMPTQPRPAPPQHAQAGSGPDWLDWQVTATRTPSGTVVQYTLSNTGQRTVLTDLLRLRVTAGGSELKFSVARVNPSGYAGRINPGEAESGTITLHQDPGGEVTLEWRVVEVGSGATYTLTRTIR